MPQILPARNVSPDVTGMRRTFNGFLRSGYRRVFDTSLHKKTGAAAPVSVNRDKRLNPQPSAFSTISRTSRDLTFDATCSSAACAFSLKAGVYRRHCSSVRARRAAT
ncbi:hypothetical protein ABH944_002944 [Caballeronia udeis]|uniref:Uncharacterized protein n=1 Tax=Caballeronia udeis TaxID=1232866 RepID=A0ABW8MGN1_9BURK